jgi:hypothetical protein
MRSETPMMALNPRRCAAARAAIGGGRGHIMRSAGLVASTVSFEEIPNGTREASYMNGTNTASLILGIL